MQSPVLRNPTLTLLAFLALSPACDSGASAPSPDVKDTKSSGQQADAPGQAVATDQAAPLAKDKVRSKEICAELFTAALAAEATGLDFADHPEKAPMAGNCNIGTSATSYRSGMTISVYEDAGEAARTFEDITRDSTAAEVGAAMKEVEAQAGKDDPGVVAAGKPVTNTIVDGAPSTTFEELPGIGTKARLSTQSSGAAEAEIDYAAHVLVRNVTLQISFSAAQRDGELEKTAVAKLAAMVSAKVQAL